jgi:hypothetical protein
VLLTGNGADAWACWLGAARYTQGAAPARRAPVLGVCIAAQLELSFHTVFKSGWPSGMAVCVRLNKGGSPLVCVAGSVVPSFETVPSADS